jgi:hypothetical protein
MATSMQHFGRDEARGHYQQFHAGNCVAPAGGPRVSLRKTRQGGIAAGGKLCCLYRFTDQPTFDIARIGLRAVKASQRMAESSGRLAEAAGGSAMGFKRKNAR